MGSPGYILRQFPEQYIPGNEEDYPITTTTSRPTAAPRQPPETPTPSGGGGGFFSGLLDVLRNVPITIGDPRHGHVTNIGSYNQLTAGRRLMDYGRSQGLQMPDFGSVSAGEGELFIKEALRRREQQPIGLAKIQELFPVQPDEDPGMAQTRAVLAQVPQSQWGPVAGHIIGQYGLPGFGGGGDMSGLFGAYPEAPGPAPTLPQPQVRAEMPPGPGTAPQPASPPAASPAVSQAPPAVPGQPGPPVTSPAAPSAAPLAQQQAGWNQPALPPEPPPPSREVLRKDVQAYGPVQVALQAYRANPTLANRENLRKTVQGAGPAILKERDQDYMERRKLHQDQMRTAIEFKKARLEEIKATAPSTWGVSQDVQDQLIMDYPQLVPGVRPTPEMVQAAEPRAAARVAANKAQETWATREAGTLAEAAAKRQLPLEQALGPTDRVPYDSQGFPVTTGTYGQAQDRAQTGEVTFISKENAQKMEAFRAAAVAIRDVNEKIQAVYKVADIYRVEMSPAERLNPLNWLERNWDRLTQNHPELIEAQRAIDISYMPIATGLLGGDKRVGQEELKLLKGAFPQLFATMDKVGTLHGHLGNWMAGVLGVTIPFGSPSLPDRKEVALSTMDTTMKRLNELGAAVLNRREFQFPGVVPRTREEQQRARTAETRAAEEAAAERRAGQEALVKDPLGSLKKLPRKAAEWAGLTPDPSAKATKPGGKAAPGLEITQTALRAENLQSVPHPTNDAAKFQAFVNTARTHLKQRYPTVTEAELDEYATKLAQKYGGVWQRPQAPR